MNLNDQVYKRKIAVVETSLKMFLMMRSEKGRWQNIVCSSPNDAVRAWKADKKYKRKVGILHIGFDQPPFHDFDNISNQYIGCVLITTTAKHTLPALFLVSAKPIAFTGNFTVYLALQGWGYSLKDITANTNDALTEASDWLTVYIERNPKILEMLNAHKIYDDASYLKAERYLDPTTRQCLGAFRSRYLLGENCHDPCKLASVVPSWLASRSLDSLSIGITARRVFKVNNLQTISDLATWTSERLLKEPFFGYKTLYHTWMCLNDTLDDTPMRRTRRLLNRKRVINSKLMV